MNNSPLTIGGSKDAEYKRTIELFEQIFKEKGTYYAIAFLYDSQYGNADLKNMLAFITPQKINKA